MEGWGHRRRRPDELTAVTLRTDRISSRPLRPDDSYKPSKVPGTGSSRCTAGSLTTPLGYHRSQLIRTERLIPLAIRQMVRRGVSLEEGRRADVEFREAYAAATGWMASHASVIIGAAGKHQETGLIDSTQSADHSAAADYGGSCRRSVVWFSRSAVILSK
ncbi:hypothetical protein ACE41H_21330 [Paenibacillus enshidis]|uniref:Uncharacterized protein n=1 Tax=Paenibacillus enshidis TaxID=1458439 RepID=A0ABV5AZA7_9BACL